jgi:hypothetical protein
MQRLKTHLETIVYHMTTLVVNQLHFTREFNYFDNMTFRLIMQSSLY